MIGISLSMVSNPSQVTVIQQAIAVLRKYGSDAHIYLPGVGMMNGLQASNYLDSAGTTVGTVDQPVGLVLDAAGSLGVELSPGTGTTAGWSAINASVATSAGNIVATATVSGANAVQVYFDIATTIGSTYKLSEGVAGYTATLMTALRLRATTTAFTIIAEDALAGPELGELHFVATATTTRILARLDATFVSGVSTLTLNASSVREVIGIHASQPTTSAKPILRRGAVCLNPYSGDLSNAAWSKSRTTATLTASDPVGNVNSATVLTEDTTSGTHEANIVATITVASGAVHTNAIVIRAAGRNFARLTLGDGVLAQRVHVDIDLAAGTVGAAALTGTATSTVAPSIMPMGSGYYLVAISGVMGTSTSITSYIRASDTLGNVVYTGSGASALHIHRAALFQGTYTAQQIQALGGIPLTTTAPASTALGPQYWQFDGSNDSLSLGGPLFQMADDHCVVAGATPTAGTTSVIAAVSRSASGISTAALLYTSAGSIASGWRDSADTAGLSPASLPSAIGVACVATAIKRGNLKELRRNGISGGVSSVAPGAAEISTGSIGSNQYGNFMNGAIYPVIAIKGTVPDADLLLLEKFVGQLSGVQI